MALEDSVAHQLLNTLQVTEISLHSVVSPAGGVSELSGGSYSRQPAQLKQAVGRARLMQDDAVFTLNVGHSPKAIGFWNGPAFVGFEELTNKPDVRVDGAQLTIEAAHTGISM